jgi:hypothetical protein
LQFKLSNTTKNTFRGISHNWLGVLGKAKLSPSRR